MACNPLVRKVQHPVTGEDFFYPQSETQDKFENALSFQAEKDDIFICSYMKSGTTWLQHIVWLITHHGQEYFKGKLTSSIPFLDFQEPGLAEHMKTNNLTRIFKTHLPQKWVPYHTEAKYLYVARNPKDILPSWSNHLQGFEKYAGKDVSVPTLFKYHMADEVPYASQVKHIGEWYQKRNEHNVLFLYYKDMKTNPRAEILKIANFLNREYGKKLSENDEILLREIVEKSSFEYMSKLPVQTWVSFLLTLILSYPLKGHVILFFIQAMA